MLLDQIDALTAQIGKLTARIEELIAAIPAAQGVDADGTTGPARAPARAQPVLPAVARLDEITGIGAGRRPGHHRRDRPGHEPVPHRRPPGVLGQAVPAHHPVRGQQPLRARPARATPTSKASSARPPPRPPGPTPSSANATGGSSNAAASSRPSSPSPAPSWSSSGTCSPTPPPATTTSAPTTTPAASTRTARPATTSASSKRSATPSPSPRPPDLHRSRQSPARVRCRAAWLRWVDFPVRSRPARQDRIRGRPTNR